MKQYDIRTVLSYAAALAAPVGPAFYFGWHFAVDVYAMVLPFSPTLAVVMAVFVGAAVAAALEGIGILAGHNAVDAFDIKAWGEMTISVLCLLSYVVLGIAGTEGAVLQVTVVFLMAVTAYIQLGVTRSLRKREQTNEKRDEEADAAAERRAKQERDDNERREKREYDFRMAQLQAQKEAKIAEANAAANAKAEVAKANAAARIEKAKAAASHQEEVSYGFQETKKETMGNIWKPGMKPTELARLSGVSKGYASKYINNGAMDAYLSRQ